jgi:hypothetical protein
MKPATRFTNTMKRPGVSFVAGLLTLLFWPLTVAAQSTDIAQPTPIYGARLRGNIAARDDTDYYYFFMGDPGKVTIKLSLQKQEEFAYLKVEALDMNRRRLLELEATSSDNAQSKSLQLDQRQKIILHLKSARSSAGSAFTLSLEGSFVVLLGGMSDTPPPRPPSDNKGPQIRIISPAVTRGQGASRAEKITVTGEATDESGVKEVSVQGRIARLDGSGNFSAEISLKPGENEIVVTATDVHGNPASEKFTIKRDSTLASGSVSSPAPTPLTVDGAYYALIIAVQNYQHPSVNPLDFPISDARKVKQTLTERYTFEPGNVTLLENPDRDKIIYSLDQLSGKLRAEDHLLIFYAGHGHWDERREQGYWLPSDAQRDMRSKWISNSDLRDAVRGINAHHILLISDACFSGGLLVTREAFAKSPVVEEMLKLKSRTAMTSGALTTVPDRSVFVKYMLDSLENNPDPYLLASDLFGRIRTPVINNSPKQSDGGRPTPTYGRIAETDDRAGDFVFIRRSNPVKTSK